MKFTVNRQDLDKALTSASTAMASGGTDLTGHYLFRAASTPDKIEILTYSGRITSSATFPAVMKDADRSPFTIEGWRLVKFLGALDKVDGLLFASSRTEDRAETTVTPFTKDDNGEAREVENASQFFASLDPGHFPYWDKTYTAATVTATVPANRLAEAIGVAKLFTSDDENKPDLCVVEVVKGVLSSTNTTAVANITVPALKNSNLRLHFKDVAAILTFLALAKNEEVEVLEAEKSAFFRLKDGSYFGETRFPSALPTVNVPAPTDQYQWTFSKPELVRVLRGLMSGAAKEDMRVQIAQKDDQTLILSMENVGGKIAKRELKLSSFSKDEKARPLPEKIHTNTKSLTKLLDSVDGDLVKIGVNPFKSSGYFRYLDTKKVPKPPEPAVEGAALPEGDRYLVMIIWNKSL